MDITVSKIIRAVEIILNNKMKKKINVNLKFIKLITRFNIRFIAITNIENTLINHYLI